MSLESQHLDACSWIELREKVESLRADVALATTTIHKCNAWIAEAKPLLERGGEAERELADLRTRLLASETALKEAKEDGERLLWVVATGATVAVHADGFVEVYERGRGLRSGSGADFREAIDLARLTPEHAHQSGSPRAEQQ